MHIAYNGTTVIPTRDNNYFEGSNRSDTLGHVSMEPLERLAVDRRDHVVKFWGERLKAVGGRNPGDDSDGGGPVKEHNEADDAGIDDANDDEAVEETDDSTIIAHHQLPPVVCENMFHSTLARSAIDLTPGTGVQALCALKSSSGYTGLCHLEEQRQFILLHLQKKF